MARYARIFSSIWGDEFTTLTGSAQRLYMLLVTQPDISHAGVLPLTERRWARLASDTDADSVRDDLDELQAARYVIVDTDTEELLVRTYLKWDGQWQNPNGIKAIEKARSQVLSLRLAEVIDTTLRTLAGRPPEGDTEAHWQAPPEGDASPKSQQPAASSQQPRSMNLQQQPAATPPDRHDNVTPPDIDEAVAAVLDLAVEVRYRACAGTIRHPGRWTKKLRADLANEHSEAITRALDAGADPVDVVATITGAHLNDIHRAQAATGGTL